MLKIFIPEDIPSLNKGEMAIFVGIRETFKCLGDVEVTLYSSNPEIDRPRYNWKNVKVIGGNGLFILKIYYPSRNMRYLIFLWRFIKHLAFLGLYKLLGKHACKIMSGEIWKAYVEADVIICSHDNAMSSYHPFIIWFSKALNKPTAIYGTSVVAELLESKPIKNLLIKAAEKVDLITTREETSFGLFKQIGVKNPNLHLTADKAFLLSPAGDEAVDKILSKEGLKKDNLPMVAMTAVRGSDVYKYAFTGITDEKLKYEMHAQALADLVDYITQTIGAKVVFLPHTIGFGEHNDDRIVSKAVYNKVKNKSNVYVITNEYSAEELKGIMSKCVMAVGERTHSIIGAISMGVPSIIITYPKDFRTVGIIGKMMGQEKWLYDSQTMQSDTLIARVAQLWQEREAVHKDLMARIGEVKERSMNNGYLLKKTLESKYGMKF